MSAPLIEVRGLRAHAHDGEALVSVLAGVDVSVHAGRCLAVIGESGSGKSTLARALLALVRAVPGVTGGRFAARGQPVLRDYPEADYPVAQHWRGFLLRHWQSLYRRRVGRWRGRLCFAIAQDPRTGLSPYLRAGTQLMGCLRGSRATRLRRALELAGALELDAAALDRFPHELSTGMCQRVLVAMALALPAPVVVADEPTSKLDLRYREAAVVQLERLVREGRALVLVTHELDLVRRLADEVLVLFGGRVVERGAPAIVLGPGEHHPYTEQLRAASDLRVAPLSRPLAAPSASGCAYLARCPLAQARCRVEAPPLRALNGVELACWAIPGDPSRSP